MCRKKRLSKKFVGENGPTSKRAPRNEHTADTAKPIQTLHKAISRHRTERQGRKRSGKKKRVLRTALSVSLCGHGRPKNRSLSQPRAAVWEKPGGTDKGCKKQLPATHTHPTAPRPGGQKRDLLSCRPDPAALLSHAPHTQHTHTPICWLALSWGGRGWVCGCVMVVFGCGVSQTLLLAHAAAPQNSPPPPGTYHAHFLRM